MADSYLSSFFWRTQHGRIETLKELHEIRRLLHLANFAMQDKASPWTRHYIRRTICASIKRFPNACAGTILTMGAESVRDVSWRGILGDRVIMDCFRLTLTGSNLLKMEALEIVSRKRNVSHIGDEASRETSNE